MERVFKQVARLDVALKDARDEQKRMMQQGEWFCRAKDINLGYISAIETQIEDLIFRLEGVVDE